MPVGGVLLFLLIATAASVRAVCNVSYQTKCDGLQEIPTYGSASAWTNLLVECGNCDDLEVLKREVFKSTPNLEMVFIVGKLRDLEAGAFDGLSELNSVVLYRNQLGAVKTGWFNNFRGLARLDLKDNNISGIENNAFGKSEIKIIDLSGNYISSLNKLALNLPGLKKLIISNNSLMEISEFAFHEDLVYLDLSRNRLSTFGLNVFNPLKNLKTLILNNNRIRSLVAFPGVVSLEKLDLSHNRLKVIEEKALMHFPRLKELQLQHNDLVYLNPKSFPQQSALEKLLLAANKLVFIPGEMAGVLHELKYMSIGGNPWTCSCLVPVQNFIRMQRVVLEECDRRFFADGSNPICLSIGTDQCTGREWEEVPKEDMKNVEEIEKQYKC